MSLVRRFVAAVQPFGLLVVLAWPAVLLAWVAVSLPDEPSEFADVVEPVWADPVEITIEARTPVEGILSGAEADQLVSPGWQGIVSRVDVAVGDTVASNDVVAVVGTMPVVAVESEEPFTRDLTANDRGSDVVMLQEFLSEGGFYSSEHIDGVFKSATGIAVKAWRKSIGDQSADRSFLHKQVLWLSGGAMKVASIEIDAGRAAPGADAAVLVGQKTFQSGRLVVPETAQEASIEAGVLLVVSERFALGAVSGAALTDAQLAELSGLLADGSVTAIPPATAPTSGGSAGSEVRVPAELASADPPLVVAVPGSAVLSGADGSACLVESVDGTGSVVLVEVVGGELGVVYLDPDEAPSSSVLVNPTDAAPELACD